MDFSETFSTMWINFFNQKKFPKKIFDFKIFFQKKIWVSPPPLAFFFAKDF